MKRKIHCIGLIILINLICYGNTLFNGFVYDDRFVILNSSLITSFNNLPFLFTKSYFLKTVELSYRPVVTLSYFIDYFFWGKSPFGYHLSNFLIHTLNAIILFLILTKLIMLTKNISNSKWEGSNYSIILIPTLFFAIHPVTTEAVNVISYREDLLATLFILLSILFSIFYFHKRNVLMLILPTLSFLLALFSKEIAIIFPLLILIIIIFKLVKRNETADIKDFFLLIPFVIVLTFYLWIRFKLMAPVVKSSNLYQFGIEEKILNFFYLFTHHLRVLLLPIFLRADYVFIPASRFPMVLNIINIIVFLLYLFLTFYFLRKNKIIAFGLLWILFGFFSVSNIIPLINPIADRYLYFSSIGLCLIVLGISKSLFCKEEYSSEQNTNNNQNSINKQKEDSSQKVNLPQTLFYLLSILILLCYAYSTVNRNVVWGDEKILWESNLRLEPNSIKAYNGLAIVAQKEGNIDKAIEYLKSGLMIKDDDIKMLNNLGVMYMKKGDYSSAIEKFKKVLDLNSRHSSTHYNLFRCYLNQESVDIDKAKYHLRKAKDFGYPVSEKDSEFLNMD